MKELRAAVIIKKANKAGSRAVLKHICKPAVFHCADNQERTVQDRLMYLDTNLSLGADRDNPLMLSKMLDSYFEGKAKRNHLSIVISVEKCLDDDLYQDAIKRTRLAAQAWIARFAPNSKYIIAGHGDRFHAHVHLIVCNQDLKRRVALNFSPRDIVYMNSFGWCPPEIGLVPGAGLYATKQSLTGFPKAETMPEQVKAIAHDPAGRLQAMVDEGMAVWYHPLDRKTGKEGTAWGLEIKDKAGVPHRYTLAGISYSLRQAGAPFGVRRLPDGKLAATALPKPTRSAVEQQERCHLAMGVNYGACTKEQYEQYLYDWDILPGTTPEEQAELHHFLHRDADLPPGRLADRVEKVTNAHLKRRLVYGETRYHGPNRKVVGYLYSKEPPSPGQKRLAGKLSEDFVRRLPLRLRKRAGPWEEFLCVLGYAERLADLLMPKDPPPLA